MMKGIEIARAYFEDCGKDVLQEKFPDLYSRMAVGLVGLGSECLGYDDEISRDHDFGPGFCIWLSEEDYVQYGLEVQQVYDMLPKTFRGITRVESMRGRGRVGVFSISRFYRQFIGDGQAPQTLVRWLMLPEEKLACVTNGSVFEDHLGEFTRIREALLSYYPEDVRIKKVAARAAVMAQSGQYNYARCMRRGEIVAAEMAIGEFVQASMKMVYLCNRVYAPFYKWLFRGMKDLPILSEAAPLIEELISTPIQTKAWRAENLDIKEGLNLADLKVCLIEKICRLIIVELKRQNLTESDDDFLEYHTVQIMSHIQNEELRNLSVLIG